MKKTICIICCCTLFTLACNNAGNSSTENKDLLSTEMVNNPRSAAGTDTAALNALPRMEFEDTVHDFGTIRQGEVVNFDFAFTNTGKKPLIISHANGSCGCTVAEFPRDPLAPGASSVISVRFNSAGKEGHQEKSVTLVTNSIRGTEMLFIKGEVKE